MTPLLSLLLFSMIPNRLKILNFSLNLFVYFFCNIIMAGEPTHTASKERMAPELMFSPEHVPQLSNTASKVQWPLRFAFSYVQPITHRQKTVKEVPLQKSSHHENMMIRAPPTINYCFESAAAITLCFQLCSARYTALQMKNSVRIISAINPVSMENTDNSHLLLGSHALHYHELTPWAVRKRNGIQRRTEVSP